MTQQKVEFVGAQGNTLVGALELPDGAVHYTALFAHCFACGKDSLAAARISRALAREGVAVLRFDFTGLGGSEGDFGNAGFASNVQDLLAAARWLEQQQHAAPQMLLGHSLGGLAVLMAALQLLSVRAVVTIGAPSQADHVLHLLAPAQQALDQGADRAPVRLGTREFDISRSFIDDLRRRDHADDIRRLRAALLIFHSPVDQTVDIDEARKLFEAARHPKSFISLDGADHLLSRREDADFVAQLSAAWARRHLDLQASKEAAAPAPAPAALPLEAPVQVSEIDHRFLCELAAGAHRLLADEPASVGGSDKGPTPYDLLLMSLGACTAMTLRLYAQRKSMPLEDVQVLLEHDRLHARDCAECEGREGQLERIRRRLRFKGPLSEAQRTDLLRIADRCPVHRTLEGRPVIVTSVVDQG
ncbi:alpha/beta fold hydrolase [Variovorax sp. LARHSF232]